jgi:sugar O-acyltransferase (sialic acid O-acetyltransferase NeuD family)
MGPVDAAPTVAIFGGRGAGVLAAHALRRACAPRAPVVQFLNDVEAVGAVIEGTPVVGPFESWRTLPPETLFLAPLHKAKAMEDRIRRVASLGVPDERWANIVDPAAMVDGELAGSGIWIQAGAMVMPGARVGSHVALRSGCCVSHDCVVEDFANVGIGVILCGYSVLETGAYIGAGAIVRDGVRVGRGSVVGLGAVVVADVAPGAIVVGNPARPV